MDAASVGAVRGARGRARVLGLGRARHPPGRARRPGARPTARTSGSSSGRSRARTREALALATPEATQLPPHVVELAVERSGRQPAVPARPARRGRRRQPRRAARQRRRGDDGPHRRARPGDARDRPPGRRYSACRSSPTGLSDVLAPGMPPPDERFWDRCRSCSRASRTGTCASAGPRSRRWPIRASRSSCGASSTMAVGLRLEREQDGDHDADAAVLSNHFALAGDHARAHRYAMLAAKRATERFSHADAVRLYRRAIDAGAGARGRTRTAGRSPRRGSRWARRCGASASRRRRAGP